MREIKINQDTINSTKRMCDTTQEIVSVLSKYDLSAHEAMQTLSFVRETISNEVNMAEREMYQAEMRNRAAKLGEVAVPLV